MKKNLLFFIEVNNINVEYVKRTLTMFSLFFITVSASAQTQFWSDTFEDVGAPSSGMRTPEYNGGSLDSYFLNTDGVGINVNSPTYSGMQGTKFWAGEDHDGFVTGQAEQQIDWTIDITGLTNLSFKGLFAANNGVAWENILYITHSDYIIVEYKIDAGAYQTLFSFQGNNITNRQLAEDTDGDGLGDGTPLNYAFSEHSKTIVGTGTTLSLRISSSANGIGEEWAIDNFRLYYGAPVTPTVTTTTTTAANIGAVRATLGGTVTAGAPLLAKGIVWSTAATTTTPTLANNVVTNGSTATGAYSDFATGLTPSTLIYYRAYATNNVGTSYGAVLSFTTNAVLAAAQSQTDVTCNGGSNGTATVVTTGGKTHYTYAWSPSGGTGATASGLTAGTYNITITDSDASTLVKTFDILQPAATPISFTGNPPNRTICPGSNTTFPATAVNATSYQWLVNTGSGYSTITNGGVYSGATTATLTITGGTASMSGYLYQLRASSLCNPSGVTSNPATLTVPSMTVSTIAKGNVQCYGDNSGSAFLSVSGGITPYTYSWAPSGGSASSASNLAPGTYTVTVTDNIVCSTTHQVVINGPTVALTATPSTTSVSCFGGSNGTASVTPVGGTTGYTYAWSTGAATQTISGSTAGTYSVTVTDGNGCELEVDNIVIGQPAAILNGTPSTTPVSCFGGSNGTATIAPNGGTPGYTYEWSNGGTTASITGVQAGTYSVTITDANSCQKLISDIVVGGPAAALDGTPSITAVSCNGGSNGTATITPIGGTANYTYDWSTGATSQTITGLQAGTYSVTITDANSCQKLISNILVSQPTVLTANPTQTNVSCFNGANGTATVTPTGGAGGYTYLWAHSGSTNASVTGLTAGTYSVKITDANACERDQSFTISEPAAIVLTPGTINNVSCYNGSNGTATVSAAGGAGSFTYSWSPAGGTAATASGLAAGTYTVTVTDANSCQETETFTITQPAAALTVSGTSQDNITCEGTPSGSATVTVNGGTGAYTHLWTPTGGTAATATGLYSGTYIVYITDANGCETSETFTITEPADPLTASSGTVANIACYGDTTGSAEVNVTGGDGNYTYSWSPSGGTGATANNLVADTYTVTVTDGASCQTTQTFTITQPAEALSASTASTAVSCFGGSNGIASVTVSGGTFPYTYAWTPLGGIGSSISGRPAGDYTCTITDGNGCTLIKTVTISSPAAFLATTIKTDVSCSGGSNGTATVTPSGATAPYSYSWSPTGGSNASASGLSAGDYTVTVQDGNFCVYNVEITINEPDLLVLTPSQINVSCPGGNNGEASVIATGGTAPYTYIWSPAGGTAATATGLTAGNYSVLVTDFKGCSTTQSFTIISTPDNIAPVPNITNLPDITSYCSVFSSEITVPTATDNCAGTVTATTTDLLDYTATGNYIVNWTYDDGNGNITIQTQTIIVLDSPLDLLTFSDKTVTYNGSIQTIEVGNLPSDAIVTYSTVPATTSDNGALNAGTYTITALVLPGTSAPNCSGVILSAQLEILLDTLPPVPSVSNLPNVIGYCSISSSEVEIPTAVDNVAGNITASTVSSLNFNIPGTYTVIWVYDDGNGNHTVQNQIFEVLNLTTSKVTETNVSCKGGSDGSATVNVTGGTNEYTYSWFPSGGTASTATGLSAGEYTVTVTDSKGCTATQSFNITQPDALSFTTTSLEKYNYNSDYTQTFATSGGTGNIAFEITTGILPAGFTLSSAGVISGKSTQVADSNFTITATDANNCTASQNFDLKLSQIPITVTATVSQSKVYGDNDPVLTYTVTPSLLPGDTFSGNLTRVAGNDAGIYPITQGTLSAGTNYTLTYVGNNFTIVKANQTITWNQTLGFGCEAETTVILTAASNSGLPVSYTSSNSNLVSISGNSLNLLDYGLVTISASQSGNNNYNPAEVVTIPLVNSQPNLIRKHFENIIFFDNSSMSYNTYTWYKNGILVAGQTDQYFKENGPLNGTYYAVATKLNGIVVTTCPLVLSPTVEEEYIKIVPNPVKPNGTYELLTNVSSSRLQNARVEVYSVGGLLMENKTTSQNTVSLKAPMVEGIYIVKMTLANGKYFTKNVLVKN